MTDRFSCAFCVADIAENATHCGACGARRSKEGVLEMPTPDEDEPYWLLRQDVAAEIKDAKQRGPSAWVHPALVGKF